MTLKDGLAVVLHVLHTFLEQLFVLICALVQVGRLSNQQVGHLVYDELLSDVQRRQRRKRLQSLPSDKLDQVELLGHRDVSFGHHPLEPLYLWVKAPEGGPAAILLADQLCIFEIPLHVPLNFLFALNPHAHRVDNSQRLREAEDLAQEGDIQGEGRNGAD